MPVCQAIYNCRLDEWRMFKSRTCSKAEHVPVAFWDHYWRRNILPASLTVCQPFHMPGQDPKIAFYFCVFLKMACWYAIFAQETTMHRCGESRVHSETKAGDCDKFTLQGTEWNSFHQTGTKLPFSPLNGNDLNPEMTFSAKHFSSVFAYHYFFFIEWKMSTIKGITRESGLPLLIHYMGNRMFFNF